MSFMHIRDPAQRRLLLLTAILFVSYRVSASRCRSSRSMSRGNWAWPTCGPAWRWEWPSSRRSPRAPTRERSPTSAARRWPSRAACCSTWLAFAILVASLLVEAPGQCLVWRAGDPSVALVGAFLAGLGCSMIFPAMGREVVRVVAPSLRGTALGAFAAFQDVAYGLTGPLAGWLADRAGVASVFLVGAAAAVLGLAIVLGLRCAAAVTAPA